MAAAVTLTPMKAVLPALARPLLEPQLPADLDVAWFANPEEAKAAIAEAEIAWVDMQPTRLVAETIRSAGPNLKWVSTIYAGLDAFPLDDLKARGVKFEICEITIRTRNLKKEQFIMDADFTPSGVARIGSLQFRERYAYIKP